MTPAGDEINTRAIKRKLVETSVRLRPTEVYVLDEKFDRHPAHRLGSKLARDSVLEAGIVLTGGIWAYEILQRPSSCVCVRIFTRRRFSKNC
jgi:hypothetical protein